ncbi:MAG: hypothetical protein NW224_01785 [Leptolyngbyaceae cyanobacterium bins.302]|nr:hypothetical protein [Leptolyngbyaceae cyanobacterium bins.302]
MPKIAVPRHVQKICKVGATLLLTFVSWAVMSWNVLAWAEPTPVTPSTATYQIEHSKSPAEAGQKLQRQSKAYKQELKKSPQPIPNAAKDAADKTKSLFQLFSKRTQETLNSNSSK